MASMVPFPAGTGCSFRRVQSTSATRLANRCLLASGATLPTATPPAGAPSLAFVISNITPISQHPSSPDRACCTGASVHQPLLGAPLRQSRSTNRKESISSISPIRWGGLSHGYPGTTSTLLAGPRPVFIHTRSVLEFPAMSQTIHPLDIAVDEFDTAHRALVRAFLATGNTIDDAERLALDVVEQAHRMVREYRLRQVAGDSFTRNGDSRVTRDRFADAGFGVIDFERERAKHATNVIALFPNNRTAS